MEPFLELEQKFATWVGVDPTGMVGCSSGTAALHLALEALRLPKGAEVIMPDLTMVACTRAVSLAGLTPVFVDCGEDLLMEKTLIPQALELKTKALMAVHVYGRGYGMEPPGFSPGSFYFIEDLAEAHGIKPHSMTDIACWSFYRNKIIAGEEGGAVWFRDSEHAKLARSLRSMGFTDAHDFMHLPGGHNYRMSNAHAKLILDSLARADENIRQRRQMEARYDLHCPDEWRMPRRDAVWVYDLRIPGMTKEFQDGLVRGLQAEGIAARHCFKPMHMQEEYKDCKHVGGEVAERMSREVIYLPVSPTMTEGDAVWAVAAVKRIGFGIK